MYKVYMLGINEVYVNTYSSYNEAHIAMDELKERFSILTILIRKNGKIVAHR